MKKKSKVTLESAINYTEYRLELLKNQYNVHAKDFAYYVSIGVGLTNIHDYDTLISLGSLYRDIVAHEDALRSMKVEY